MLLEAPDFTSLQSVEINKRLFALATSGYLAGATGVLFSFGCVADPYVAGYKVAVIYDLRVSL
jgi:hypothetical protein